MSTITLIFRTVLTKSTNYNRPIISNTITIMVMMISIVSNITVFIINLNFQDGAYEVDQEFDGKGLTPYDPAHNSTYLLSGQ